MTPITADQFKKKQNDSMVKVISDWERSGAGSGMVNNIVVDDDNNNETEPPEYEFIDRDDLKSFLGEHPPHVVYPWPLSHKYGILRRVRQQLDSGSTVDRTNAPSVDTTCKKRKHSPSSTDSSISNSGRIMKNMEQIADSINGLVGVARQSHQTQQINILHRCQKELEDSIQTLDGPCMELELCLLEAIGMRKQVFECAFTKKRQK